MGGPSILTPSRRGSATLVRGLLPSCESDAARMGNAGNGVQRVEADALQLVRDLGPDPTRRIRIGEQNRSQRDRRGARRGQLDGVPPGRDAAHPDDRQRRRAAVAARQAATISAADSGASSTFGQERFSSIVTPSRRSQVSAYSCAEKPPTETQSGSPSSRSRGSDSARKRSRPGFASPIEFSIP